MTTVHRHPLSPSSANEALPVPDASQAAAHDVGAQPLARRTGLIAEITWRCLQRAIDPCAQATAPLNTADVPVTMSLRLAIERNRGRGRMRISFADPLRGQPSPECRTRLELPVSGRCVLEGRWLVMTLTARTLLRADPSSQRTEIRITAVFDVGESSDGCPVPMGALTDARLAYVHSNLFPELGIPGGRYGAPRGALQRQE